MSSRSNPNAKFCQKQKYAVLRIVAVSNSYDDNHYTTDTSKQQEIGQSDKTKAYMSNDKY